MITSISIDNFNKLCDIEENRMNIPCNKHSILVWKDDKNNLKMSTIFNLINVELVRNDIYNSILETQSRPDFKCWLLLDWQKEAFV